MLSKTLILGIGVATMTHAIEVVSKADLESEIETSVLGDLAEDLVTKLGAGLEISSSQFAQTQAKSPATIKA